MFRIIIISIAAIIGLTGCGDDAAQKSVNEGSMAVKVNPVLAKNEMNTQDVKKNDVQPVAIQSQTAETSQAVAAMLAKSSKTIEVEPMRLKQAVKEKLPVEAMKVKATAVASPAKPELTLGDAVKGKSLAKRCVACHRFDMKDKVGPHLQGVFNRAAGQSGFKRHSAALKAANWHWDEAHLLKWVCDSKSAIKAFTGDPSAKTKMPKQGMCGVKGNDVVAYLKTL